MVWAWERWCSHVLANGRFPDLTRMLCVPRWHMDQWNLIDLGWYGVGMGGLALGCTRRCYARPWLESLHVQTFTSTTRAWHGTHQIMLNGCVRPRSVHRLT